MQQMETYEFEVLRICLQEMGYELPGKEGSVKKNGRLLKLQLLVSMKIEAGKNLHWAQFLQ